VNGPTKISTPIDVVNNKARPGRSSLKGTGKHAISPMTSTKKISTEKFVQQQQTRQESISRLLFKMHSSKRTNTRKSFLHEMLRFRRGMSAMAFLGVTGYATYSLFGQNNWSV